MAAAEPDVQRLANVPRPALWGAGPVAQRTTAVQRLADLASAAANVAMLVVVRAATAGHGVRTLLPRGLLIARAGAPPPWGAPTSPPHNDHCDGSGRRNRQGAPHPPDGGRPPRFDRARREELDMAVATEEQP